MKKSLLLIFVLAFSLHVLASKASKEVPVQHLKIADVTSMEDAKKIFNEKTLEIKSKKKLDQIELQQIHVITYSLEKSVAYFAENLKDSSGKQLAKDIAVVVEDIHISSENNQQERTEAHLYKYFNLADKFKKYTGF
jgi:hypothetical protein